MFLSFSMCFIQFFSFPVKQDLIFLIFVAKIDVFSEIQISAIFELISCFFFLEVFFKRFKNRLAYTLQTATTGTQRKNVGLNDVGIPRPGVHVMMG